MSDQNGEVKAVTAEIAKAALDRLREENKGVHPIVEGLILGAYERLDKLHHAMYLIAQEHRQIREVIMGGAATVENGGAETVAGDMPAAPTVRLGADGNPLTGAQLAAEEAMDAAAGPRDGVQAAPAPMPVKRNGNGPQRPMPPRGGVRMPPAAEAPITETRLGADGNPLSPEQEAAERAMDEAAGPRA